MSREEYFLLIKSCMTRSKQPNAYVLYRQNGSVYSCALKNSPLSQRANCKTIDELTRYVITNINDEVVEEFFKLNYPHILLADYFY
jgi:hypothetical protein